MAGSFRYNQTIWGASVLGDLERLRVILSEQEGRDQINEENKYGYTPLQAASFSSPEVVRLLLDHGANPNALDRNPVDDPWLQTPLHEALRQGREESATILIRHGTALHLQDRQGNLPLHIAAERSSLQVISLIADGTELNHFTLRNRNGRTPLQLAEQRGNGGQIVQFLQSRYMHTHQDFRLPTLEHLCRLRIRASFGADLHRLEETLRDQVPRHVIGYLLLRIPQDR